MLAASTLGEEGSKIMSCYVLSNADNLGIARTFCPPEIRLSFRHIWNDLLQEENHQTLQT